MKRIARTPARSAQSAGFTLIELLISMTLGMVVVGALLVTYLGASSAGRTATAQRQMNEDAQIALEVLSQDLRRTGFNPVRSGGVVNDLNQDSWTLFACDNGFTDGTVAQVSVLTCAAAGGKPAIAIVYEGDQYAGRLDAAGDKLLDCVGNGVPKTIVGGETYFIMQARYYLDGSTLKCRGSGDLAQTQTLAENLESMQLSFAVTDPAVTASKDVRGYLTATEINQPIPSLVTGVLTTPKDRWKKVAAVRVCVVVVSEESVLADNKNQEVNPTYTDCSNQNIDITDGKMRRAYSTTVILANHGVGYVDP